ncbi:MAG: hypothetical protein U5S82_20560 [Gammaproteobacteria bacterium]|nr:hypothetical protein [Gammaproteobacteria bacterium]
MSATAETLERLHRLGEWLAEQSLGKPSGLREIYIDEAHHMDRLFRISGKT